jgi:Zn-dependent alcohol dehydrogenase
LEPIITHHLPLAEIEQGLKLMQAGQAIKVILEVPQV